MRKGVFRVSDTARLIPAHAATQTSQIIKIFHVASLAIIRFRIRITKVLIRLNGCADWSARWLFAYATTLDFLQLGPFNSIVVIETIQIDSACLCFIVHYFVSFLVFAIILKRKRGLIALLCCFTDVLLQYIFCDSYSRCRGFKLL